MGAEVIDVGLHDCLFAGNASATLAGDCAGEAPQHIRWQREGQWPVTVYTDGNLRDAVDAPGRRIAWLIEPLSLRDSHYREAVELEGEFDAILTHNVDYARRGDKWQWYPFGGSWIRLKDWRVYDKTRGVSLIASAKTGMEGHKLRHEVAAAFGDSVDVMGGGYRLIASKLEGLADYRYSIVIENCRDKGWFTEKLLDCFACGTVPIYWGTSGLPFWFRPEGIMQFSTIDALRRILSEHAIEAQYQRRLSAVEDNLEIARRYRCAEDTIYGYYPELFT